MEGGSRKMPSARWVDIAHVSGVWTPSLTFCGHVTKMQISLKNRHTHPLLHPAQWRRRTMRSHPVQQASVHLNTRRSVPSSEKSTVTTSSCTLETNVRRNITLMGQNVYFGKTSSDPRMVDFTIPAFEIINTHKQQGPRPKPLRKRTAYTTRSE